LVTTNITDLVSDWNTDYPNFAKAENYTREIQKEIKGHQMFSKILEKHEEKVS